MRRSNTQNAGVCHTTGAFRPEHLLVSQSAVYSKWRTKYAVLVPDLESDRSTPKKRNFCNKCGVHSLRQAPESGSHAEKAGRRICLECIPQVTGTDKKCCFPAQPLRWRYLVRYTRPHRQTTFSSCKLRGSLRFRSVERAVLPYSAQLPQF